MGHKVENTPAKKRKYEQDPVLLALLDELARLRQAIKMLTQAVEKEAKVGGK